MIARYTVLRITWVFLSPAIQARSASECTPARRQTIILDLRPRRIHSLALRARIPLGARVLIPSAATMERRTNFYGMKMSRDDFNTGEPIAFFITWTTYGTWLPGDDRGWNRKGEFEHRPPDPLFNEAAAVKLKETPFLLKPNDRQIVEITIGKHCEIRAWELHIVNVRSNHVHVVVTAPDYQPETVAAQFKAWSTRKLKPNHPDRKRFWTQGASCRWINQAGDLDIAIEYASEAQDRKGVEYEK